jgi:tetratricopeptide (TPR) repeat protein
LTSSPKADHPVVVVQTFRSARHGRPEGLHYNRHVIAFGLAILAVTVWTIGVRAELPEWVRNIDPMSRFHDAFFRTVLMPNGPVEVRRPPAETHEALARIDGAAAGAAATLELLAKRARAAEEQLDPASAEVDWKAYASASPDAGEGQVALADFYHRRLMPQEEAAALAAAARAADPAGDRLVPPAERRSWRLFERLFALIAAQQLPDALAEAQYRAWMARYPGEALYDRLFRFLVARDRTADAGALLTLYQQAFPADEGWPLQARAELATHRGATADALSIYDQAFRPLWPAEITRAYFDLIERNHGLRAFLDRARADIAARPDDLGPAARVYYYYQRAGNVGSAEQSLADFEARRENAVRSADELLTLARLYEKTRNYNQALRYDSAIYTLPGATAADVEQALASIIETLFAAPEQPLRFGSGDLSFYRDIATLDPYPGFLNGLLSLLFNSTSPRDRFANEEAASASYFHRGRAADLLTLFDTRFPASPRRADLNATLIETYAAYGEADAVLDRGRRFLDTFAASPRRTAVSLAMADGFARKNQVVEELAAYDRLLQELAARADRVPLGAAARADESSSRSTGAQGPRTQGPGTQGPGTQGPGTKDRLGARSQEYARVLDRYIARLVSLDRLPDALAVYRREIDRNPDDPGLYAAAAQFLEQNNLTAVVEQIYRRAIQQFPDRSWHHRLARWYLRRNEAAAFDTLTRDVVRAFDGTDLAGYFESVVGRGPAVSARLYLQVNLYAHERFPHHLAFVRNLLSAYSDIETRDPAAFAALLQRHWFEDEGLSAQFFASLSRTGRLDTELAEIRRANPPASDSNWARLTKDNPVAARFVAEAGIWRSRFETATPVLNALADEYPADVELRRRVGSLHRSLSYADAREVDAAAATGERLQRFDPRDSSTLTALGEIHADRERYDRARPYWDRIPDIEPGRAEGYLEAATIFWDYYQFDDALRVIALGRTRLGLPTMYAFEAGAIHEGMRQPQRAIDEYVRGALAGGGDSPAQARLLTLARRTAYRDLADRATGAAADGDAPALPALSLRIAVLEAQARRPDLERFLLAVLDRTSSLELMTAIGGHADRLGFEAIRTRALTRQIEVMTDPIDKLQLRYALVRLHESRGELDLARKALEVLYAENPRILGVVRQTVDYYWRHGARREAIAALVRAASAAYPALTRQFTFEAARKATGIADYAQARDLFQPLLAGDPFNPEYLAAVADTYARAKDDAALRDFYRSTIEAMRNAPIAADDRMRRIAGLRRGLIPALDRLNDRAGAVDQYIEIINGYPDDDALLQEAGRYARQHGQTDRLVAYYIKTSDDSPRDYRWPMLVAKLQTQFEDFPAAIAAYARAIAIRPDRADFHTAQGVLYERLMRFDEAVASYTKAYELTYHDPQWMEKIAELRARQGQVDAAGRALRTALVEGRPERPEPFFAVAARLEQWQMLGAAKAAADEGARLASPAKLLQEGSTYVSVYMRLRQGEATFDRLLELRRQALAALSQDANREPIDNALSARLQQMGEIAAREYAPEEKRAFAAFLEQKRPSVPAADFAALLVPLAERAGFLDLAVRWRVELMRANRSNVNDDMRRLVQLQTERMRFLELAQQLEELVALRRPSSVEAGFAAADAYRKAGDPAGEFRMLSGLGQRALSTRFFELLLERDPQRLIALAGSGPGPGTGNATLRDAVANFLVARGTVDQALAAVRARGQGLPPVWTQAYTALVGLNLSRFDATTTDAFRSVLGAGPVGDRLMPVDRATRLAGDVWFEYGSRFGEYLTFASQPDARDYLPAAIERTPARSDAYVALADFYRDSGSGAEALAEYDHAAALNARRSDVHLRAAAILWRQGRRAAAAGRWRQGMQVLTAQAPRGTIDPALVAATLDAVASRKLLPELREPADAMVRAYITRNGAFRADGLLRAVFRAAGDAASGTDWLIDLGRAAPNQIGMLTAVARAPWLPDPQRDRVYERIVALGEEAVAREHGAAQVAAQGALGRWRVQRIQSLVDTRQIARADELLRALPEQTRASAVDEVTAIDVRVAAGLKTLNALLDRYARDEDQPVNPEALRNAATALRRSGDAVSARRVLEFVYSRQIDREDLAAPAFLGLAEIRLEQGNVKAALDLLHRLSLVAGQPFEYLSASGALLERLQHPAEALEFRRARVQAVPWDAAADIALARTEIAAADGRDDAMKRLARVAESPAVRYGVRVEAAGAFASAGGLLGRPPQSEIDLLRVPASLTPAAVDRPMFVDARIAAARRATDLSARVALLLGALATDPAHAGIRLPLVRAEIALARPADAIEAANPLVARSRLLNGLGLSAADRARFARELGIAHQQVDRLTEAVRYLTVALDGEPPATRAALRQRIASINEEIARRARNETRRPRVSESLDQPQLVRPRIPPKVAAVAVATSVPGASATSVPGGVTTSVPARGAAR